MKDKFSALTKIDPNRNLGSKFADTIFFRPLRQICGSKLSHNVLNAHYAIAWDLDATLIDGPYSWFWRRWIRENYFKHKFIIVTFRTSESKSERDAIINDICNEIEKCKDPLRREWFEEVLLINPKIWNSWTGVPTIMRDVLSYSDITPYMMRRFDELKINIDRVIDINRAVRAWKAAECRSREFTLLVEDKETFCRPSCEIFGVDFLRSIPPNPINTF